MPIRACLRCGAQALRQASISEGSFPGLGAGIEQAVCRECGHVGMPLEFDDAEAWRAFRDAQAP